MNAMFYKKAADYWSKIPATLEGVLGGFGFISSIDIDGSKKFLDELFALENPPQKHIALDCGAGIGRITKDLLINVYEKVEMVEQNAAFLKEAETSIEPKSKLGRLYPVGLQNFKTDEKYDIIWCQWVLGHLTDRDFVKFFITCKNSLRTNGIIVVKENVTSSGHLERDDVDSSVTRSLEHLLLLLKKSHLSIIKQYKQNDFPVGIYPVYMFALRPDTLEQSPKADETYFQNTDQTINQNQNIAEELNVSQNIDHDILEVFQNIGIQNKNGHPSEVINVPDVSSNESSESSSNKLINM